MARRAIIILRLVRVGRTCSVTFVLVHHQMMLTAGALVRSVLAAGAIGLAWHARAVLGIYIERCKNRASRYSQLVPILRKKNSEGALSTNTKTRIDLFSFTYFRNNPLGIAEDRPPNQ